MNVPFWHCIFLRSESVLLKMGIMWRLVSVVLKKSKNKGRAHATNS